MHFNFIYFLSYLLIGILLMTNSVALAEHDNSNEAMKKRAEALTNAIHQNQASQAAQALRARIQQSQQNTLNAAIMKEPLGIKLETFSVSSSASSQPNEWLFIFVSFSMPEQTIKQYLQQAHRTRAWVVLRGLVDNDLTKTLALIESWGKAYLIKNILIDPVLYQRFKITKVPTIILTQADYPCPGEDDCLINAVDKLSGDVTLDYALQTFAREGDLKQSANNLLNTLRSRSDAPQ